jgi:hypothetical protein
MPFFLSKMWKIYVYSQSAPLPSYQLEVKNWPTCKTIKCLLKLVLLENDLMKHYIGLATILLKHNCKCLELEGSCNARIYHQMF